MSNFNFSGTYGDFRSDNDGDDSWGGFGKSWACPDCGRRNFAYSRSMDICEECGYRALSYTARIRDLVRPYKGRRIQFMWHLRGRKGRRRLKPQAVSGTFRSIDHVKSHGFMLGVKLDTGLTLKFPLFEVMPSGPALYNYLANLGWRKESLALSAQNMPLLGDGKVETQV